MAHSSGIFCLILGELGQAPEVRKVKNLEKPCFQRRTALKQAQPYLFDGRKDGIGISIERFVFSEPVFAGAFPDKICVGVKKIVFAFSPVAIALR